MLEFFMRVFLANTREEVVVFGLRLFGLSAGHFPVFSKGSRAASGSLL